MSAVDEAGVSTLLEQIREAGPEIEAAARTAEQERRLPAHIVQRFRDMELFWLKTPTELGGTELDPMDFCDVLEEIAYHDASAAWAVMIGSGTTGIIAGRLPDEGIRQVFAAGAPLPILAGQFVRNGTAERAPGGYRITGRWSFCSGITHADWVCGAFRDETDAARVFCIPKAEATLHDTWHVAGLQGTGSGDFSVSDHFVPAALTVDLMTGEPLRGGPLFRQSPYTFVGNEMGPVVIGIARRALDDMRRYAATTSRALTGVPLRDRASFHKAVGRADAELQAAWLLYRDVVATGWRRFLAEGEEDPRVLSLGMARTTHAVHSCVDMVSALIRYGGGRVLALDNPMQRHLRNLAAAGQHLAVTDEHFEAAGKALLG